MTKRGFQLGAQLKLLSLPVASIADGELVERREENGLRVYRYALTDLGTTVFATVSLAKDDKIADVVVSSE